MSDYEYLKASDGSGDAALMHVTAVRASGNPTIVVDTVVGVPAKFIGSSGTLLPSNFVDQTTIMNFDGHLDGSTLIIDNVLPGSTDNGNTEGQVVIIKPNTEWANRVGGFIENAKGFGTPEAAEFADLTAATVTSEGDIALSGATPIIKATGAATNIGIEVQPKGTGTAKVRGLKIFRGYNTVESGLIWTADAAGSTRAASMTAGVVVLNGNPLTVSAVTARVFTASKDTYIDVSDAGNGAGTLVYTEVANNATSPALTAGNMRIGIVVTGASNIADNTSINQGQPSRSLPTNCNVGKAGIDSLGNKIRNTDPNGVLCFSYWGSLLGSGDIASLTLPLLENYTYEIEAAVSSLWSGAPAVQMNLKVNVDGSNVVDSRTDVYTNNENVEQTIYWQGELSTGNRVVKLNLTTTSGGYSFTTASWKLTAKPFRT